MRHFVFLAAIQLLIPSCHVSAEERASLNAQEYDCRQSLKACLSLRGSEKKDCYLTPSLADACISSPLSRFLALRIAAENDLSDPSCLAQVDAELSGVLAKDSCTKSDLQTLQQKVASCKKNTSESLLKP